MTKFIAHRWPSFTEKEIACRCCGELVIVDAAMDALQTMRSIMDAPLVILSGHRCAAHNEAVGGALDSQHLKLAFDIATAGHDRGALYAAAKVAGFTGIGFMENGLHADIRATPAHWDYGQASRKAWGPIIPPGGGTFELQSENAR